MPPYLIPPYLTSPHLRPLTFPSPSTRARTTPCPARAGLPCGGAVGREASSCGAAHGAVAAAAAAMRGRMEYRNGVRDSAGNAGAALPHAIRGRRGRRRQSAGRACLSRCVCVGGGGGEEAQNSQFESGYLMGVLDGSWFAMVTVTTVGYGDKAPPHPHTPPTHASATATSPCTHTTARPRGPRTAHLAAAEGMASCAARGPGRQDRLGVIPGCTPRGPGRAVSRGALANDRQTATCSRGVQAEADSRRDRGRGRGPRRDASRRRKGPPPPRRATAVGSQAADVARVSRRPAPSSPTLPRRRRPTYV